MDELAVLAPAAPNRHLTEDRKQQILRVWHGYRLQVAPPGKEGGHGYQDPAITPWCDRLNALAGVCTIQSCAGHNFPNGSRTSAHLWLRLIEPLAVLFRREAFGLASDTRHVERLATIYEPTDGEVVEIIFAGSERNRLDESMVRILEFFRSLSDRLTSGG